MNAFDFVVGRKLFLGHRVHVVCSYRYLLVLGLMLVSCEGASLVHISFVIYKIT